MKYLILFVVYFCLGQMQLKAQNTRKQLENKRRKAQQEIEYNKQILNRTKQAKTTALHRIGALNQIILQRSGAIENIKLEIDETKLELDIKSQNLEQLKKSYGKELGELRKTVRQAYKSKKRGNKFIFLFGASNVREGLRRLKYLQYVAKYKNHLVKMIENSASLVKNGIAELSKVKSEQDELLNAQISEVKNLEQDKQDKTTLVKSLAGQEQEIRKKIKQNEAAVRQLNANIASLIQQQIKARTATKPQSRTNQSTASAGNKPKPRGAQQRAAPTIQLTPQEQAVSNSFAGSKGRLPWPVARGYISQNFGLVTHPDFPGIVTQNNGIDITTNDGIAVVAVFGGTVSAILTIPGQGNAVLVNHGEYYTVYSRLSDVYVSKGQEITGKQSVGKVLTDEDGKSILQFQVWQGQNKLNPALWLGGR